MNRSTPFSAAKLPVANLISRSPLRRSFSVVLLAIAFTFALSPMMRAVDPPPDGGYPNRNTAEGDSALASLVNGTENTAIGFEALFNNTNGGFNTAIGDRALFQNTTGQFNTATGVAALFSNTIGKSNTATGFEALFNNTTGDNNTANGFWTLFSNTTGDNNTANGFWALLVNTTGSSNTASGVKALWSNTTGKDNTASGAFALESNTSGNANTVIGFDALYHNTTGAHNTATGYVALFANTGTFNTAYGDSALYHNTAGSFNTAVGFNAGRDLTTGSSNIDIGNKGEAGESNTIRIGGVTQTATFIAGIRGATTVNANAIPVVIDSAGQLGTVSSSQRFKDQIEPMDKASEALLALKPVTFHYKSDKMGTPQFGLIAEEVAKVNPDLVVRNEDGEIYTVRYEAVNAMLLNEFLKEHRKVEEQRKHFESKLADQQETFEAKFAQQQKQIEALTATVQKVSDQVALSKPTPQLVANP